MFKNAWKTMQKDFGSTTAPFARTFSMVRNKDESQHSGTGKVLDGVVFPCGKVVVCWDTANNPDSMVDVNSITIFETWDNFWDVHVGQHPRNGTLINWTN